MNPFCDRSKETPKIHTLSSCSASIDFEHRYYALSMTHQLSQMENLHVQLPQLLEQLKVYSNLALPACALVICYPFSQECFIYHAINNGLKRIEIQKIQHALLPISSQNDLKLGLVLPLDENEAKLLFIGQDYVVWRLYFDAKNQHHHEILNLVDDAFAQGFEERDRQRRHIQCVLQEERKAFSADLHDSIAQILGFLRLKSAQLHQQCKQTPYLELQPHTEEIANYTHYAYQQVRELITASRLAYQELDFISTLKKVIQEFEQQSSIVFELDHRVHRLNLAPKQSVQVLYIIRESLSNIVRHSHAHSAWVMIDQQQQTLCIQIKDDGQGIRRELKRKDSFGLDIMQERAERIGAQLKITPRVPQGTCVELKLQLADEE